MEIGIMDLETSGFYADNSILLCASIKSYKHKHITTIRADQFKTWKTNKTDERLVIEAIAKELDKYDILVAHNGEWFDKGYFNAKCIEFGIEPVLRNKKTIDPCQISRRHMRLGRNSLAALTDFLRIKVHKTPIELLEWRKASHDSNKKSMDVIAFHCEKDILVLEEVYIRLLKLIGDINTKGSFR